MKLTDLDPMPKSRPILFAAEMVNAIRDDRKTQTRRVIKLKSGEEFCDINGLGNPVFTVDEQTYREIKCPYGKKGDLLWVRETFRIYHGTNHSQIYYRATPDDKGIDVTDYRDLRLSHHSDGWKPSIFMPRKASRITLEITEDPRPERVQDISERDAEAEGVDQWCDGGYDIAQGYRISFCALWDSINGDKHPWENNDWVWVVEFKRIE